MTAPRYPRVVSAVGDTDTVVIYQGGDPGYPAMATKAALLDDITVADDLSVTGDVVISGTLEVGSTDTERASIKGIYISTLAVTVPTIADAECDVVAQSVSGLTFVAIPGDLVVAGPTEALPTDCLFGGVYVTDTDVISFTFMTKEGGSGVTGAAKSFKVMIFDLT